MPDNENETVKTNETDETAGFVGSQGEDTDMSEAAESSVLNGFIIRCDMAVADLEISSSVTDEIILTKDVNAARAELKDIESSLQSMTAAHEEILKLCAQSPGLNSDVHEQRRRRFLILYKGIRNRLLNVLPSDPGTSACASQGETENATRFKLPKVDIPVFTGKADTWNNFKRLYEAIIHTNKKLSDFDKHQYLRSKLQGEPMLLVESLPLEGSQYNAAWNIIVTHYDDPFLKLSRHFDSLQSCPAMSDKRQTLRGLISHFRANVTALQTMFSEMAHIDPFSQFCIHSFLNKADKATRTEWEQELARRQSFANFREFITFMENRCSAMERAAGPSQDKSSNSPLLRGRCLQVTSSASSNCYYCRKPGHRLYKCEQFAKLTQADRNTFVKKRRLCVRCLSGRCSGSCRFTCNTCRGRHNTLIHLDKKKDPAGECHIKVLHSDISSGNKNALSVQEVSQARDEEGNHAMTPMSADQFLGWIGGLVTDGIHALLATAVITVFNTDTNKSLLARAVLDSGSQLNLMTHRMVRALGLVTEDTLHSIKGVGNISTKSCVYVHTKIQSRFSDFSFEMECLAIDEIVDVIPSLNLDVESWNIPSHLQLADESFNVPSNIDLLLGLEVFWKVLGTKFINLGDNLPRLQESQLGWLVTGNVKLAERDLSDAVLNVIEVNEEPEVNLSRTIERFWLQDVGNERELSLEEKECERFFSETTIRDASGRYIVRLPFKLPRDNLGQSKQQAQRRFFHLERRLARDDKFRDNYIACIRDYLNQGHMKEVSEQPGELCYYIPHHAVMKETSSTTKLRVVFDASMNSSTGISLNDCLMKGPVIQSDLISIVIRFRTHRYVFTADITQMYRQIRVNDLDTPFQRILWRESPIEPLKCYELTRVTFGETPAPYLATRCLKRLAEDEGERYPAARSALLNDFYVDDVLSGSHSIEATKELKKQVTDMLGSAGFQLNKWCSNAQEILDDIPKSQQEKNFTLETNDQYTVKTLGILWLPTEDTFKPWIPTFSSSEVQTPRQVLSVIASIYDPLGLLGPVLVLARLFMQHLWKLVHEANSSKEIKNEINWDKGLTDKDKKDWSDFVSKLPSLESIRIPRYILSEEVVSLIELHGFADASERAYGAVLYIRSISKNESTVRLVSSKSRVASIHKPTLPRLELCAALLLAELVEKLKKILQQNLQISTIRLWSDSEIALYWIHSPARRWQTYVANRVQRIQNASKDCVWDHVESAANPADLISRGVRPEELESCELWWNGPPWLSNNTQPIVNKGFVPKQSHQLEIRKPKCLFVGATMLIQKSILFEKFTTYMRLWRVTAWIMRFIWNFHWYGPHIVGPLQTFELDQAIVTLVKLAQRESFPDELLELQAGKVVNSKSSLKQLSPFLDARGAIRVGGRLQNSNLSYEQQHPYVLSPNHPLAKMIVEYEHKANFHAGPQLLRSILRRKFWILRQNSAIRYCITRCHTCIRFKAQTQTEAMASLPRSRVVPSKPFHICGVDYAGPFDILGKGGRHKVVVKAYIAVFVCFATKALHLEVVSDLTSESFLAALSRFVSRRGIPLEIHSDNGTTFVGANTILKNLKEFFQKNSEAIHNFSTLKGFQWHFIPPYSPHFGGLWEAGVKSVKSHLKVVFENAGLTFEQFATLLAQIEACLNSRPLVPESSDPNDINALTPGHFLIGGPITAIPNKDLSEVPMNRLKYWEKVKKLSQIFWKRWSVEYLNTLQQRAKWREIKNEIKEGDLVILKEANTAPTEWPLGRIVELHKGKDNLARVVTVQTVKDKVKRPLTRLVLLPN